MRPGPPHRRERPYEWRGIVGAHERSPDKNGIDARGQQACVVDARDAGFGDKDLMLAHERVELSCAAGVDVRRVAQIAGVGADDETAAGDRATERDGLVGFDEGAHVQASGTLDETSELVVTECFSDEQHGIRADAARLGDLMLRHDDVFAEDRHSG